MTCIDMGFGVVLCAILHVKHLRQLPAILRVTAPVRPA